MNHKYFELKDANDFLTRDAFLAEMSIGRWSGLCVVSFCLFSYCKRYLLAESPSRQTRPIVECLSEWVRVWWIGLAGCFKTTMRVG